MPAIVPPTGTLGNPTRMFGTVDVTKLPATPAGANRMGAVAWPIDTSRPLYFFQTGSIVHVAAASTLMLDLFNADASRVVRVLYLSHAVNLETAVTGIGFEWQLLRTTAVGTGGNGITAWLPDVNDAALDSDITARTKATGGATAGTSLLWWYTSSEETQGGDTKGRPANLLPDILVSTGKGIVVRPSTGLRINQETNSAEGNSALTIGFTVE